MEDYGGARLETFDELVTKHTRRELEELALKFGVGNLGGTKSQLAEAILEEMKKQKEQPKSTMQASPKEAPMLEKQKSAAKMPGFGKKGVFAKAKAIDNKAAELQKAGKDIREQGIREMRQSVKEFQSAKDWMAREMHSEAHKMLEDGQKRFNQGQVEFKRSLDSQIKENQDAVAKLHTGASEIRSSQEKMSREFQKAGRDIRDQGFKNLQNGLNRFRSDLDSQIRENREAAQRLNSGARELQGRAASFQNEIQMYQEQDLKNYVRDFYYG
ncbi:Uncharacterised protein [uncultured archaeon]|nr:Uncharacterised protein [uncultured archaeon]